MCLQYNYSKAHIVAVFIRTSGQKVLVIAPARTSRFWRYPVHCILSITFMLKDILMYQDLIRNELNEAAETLANFLKDDANIHAIQRAAVLLADSFKAGGKVLSCGNGGSHCDAMHFAEELTGRYRENRPGYPAIAISDVSHISCVGNDFGFNDIFSRYVEAVGREGDVLLGISTSGNSANVIKAIAAAREKGMKVITLTGKDGGKMAGTADIEIRVPHFGYADRIQEIHIKVIHILIQLIEKEMVK
ncbi:sedoheptulose 7-phosphate isomerase [Escherichia coli TA447]|uniref:Phosphoheptose isomerase n=1 Tax=Escherichia coli TA447 TaxID=656447 RepID=A0A1X3J5V8_ECOLX|nr:sedoheptulose 7-phosphate isomerase [Escherichia coli TA447]